MSRNCDGCGAEVADTSKFCPNCGKPMASVPPAGSADVPPPAGSVPSAAPRPAAPAGATSPAGPLAGNTGGPNIKLIAGCAGAGCLVFIIAIIIAIVVLVRSGNSNGGHEESPSDTPQQPDKPQKSDLPDQPDLPEKPGQSENPEKPNPPQRPQWGNLPRSIPPSENVPKEGGLSQLVQKQVGRFNLVKTQRMNDIIGQGAVDALKLEYRADDGSGALHLLIAWSDADQAQQSVDATADQATRQGWKKDEEGVVKSRDGQEVGKVLILSNRKMKAQLCIWNHGQVFASVMAPAGVAKEFLNAVPY